ncbi:hypothetical protein GCM10010515_58200 [Streptomyces fructofermentans]|uniref:LmbE family protein n=1 Tax=Streptomyces fructofermentans TaxID=152141 RepID=A0A918U2T3_9ACTN|nr:hypothetical protein GCM10010515_58200 [Streptomyces fructofermentans]
MLGVFAHPDDENGQLGMLGMRCHARSDTHVPASCPLCRAPAQVRSVNPVTARNEASPWRHLLPQPGPALPLAGGVLAQQAASGARTAIVTTTWAHDTTRAAELAAGLAILGAGEPRLLGYRDARNPSAAPGRPVGAR